MHFLNFFFIFLGAYALGSIPVGYLLAKLGGHGDIRQTGSGSTGATNVLRTGSKTIAFLTLFFDAAKGSAALWLGIKLSAPVEAAFGVMIGHVFPVWLRFKGGKGVATYLGLLLVMNPLLGFQTFLVWLMTSMLFHYSSLSSLVAALSVPISAALWGFELPLNTPTLSLISLFVIATHWSNILRLLSGKEAKI